MSYSKPGDRKLQAQVEELESERAELKRKLGCARSKIAACEELAKMEMSAIKQRDEARDRWTKLQQWLDAEETACSELSAMLDGATGEPRDVGILHTGAVQFIARIKQYMDGDGQSQ